MILRGSILFILPFVCVGLFIAAGTAEILLPDLVNPDSILIHKDTLLITDAESVYLYNLIDFSLRKKFGKKGEGPGEFKFWSGGVVKLHVHMLEDKIVINSMNRVTFFKSDGEYLKEKNNRSGFNFVSMGDGFAGYTVVNKNKILFLAINLYDKNFNLIKEIFRKEYYVQPAKNFNLIRTGFGNKRRAHYQVYKDKLYVEGENKLHVFDSAGREILVISPEFRRLSVEKEHSQTILNDLNKLFPSSLMKKLIKDKGYFPKYFPLRVFLIADDLIWFPTYQQKDGKTLFVVIDLKGTIIRKGYYHFRNRSLLIPYPFAISKGKVYQLIDNSDEEWSLFVSKME